MTMSSPLFSQSIVAFSKTHAIPLPTISLALDTILARHPPSSHLSSLPSQGGCSHTFLLITPVRKAIIQLRPLPFALDPEIYSQAEIIHPSIVPYLVHEDSLTIPGLQLLEFQHLESAVQASSLLPSHPSLSAKEEENLASLLRDLADFFVRSRTAATRDPSGSSNHENSTATKREGKIFISIHPRLAALAAHLPTEALRARARLVHRKVATEHSLDRLPLVLTHGDFLPGNFLVEAPREGPWRLGGVVDWAEAEYLPFGVGMGGVERFLGYEERTDGAEGARGRWKWRYYFQAERLRGEFWERVWGELGTGVKEEVELAREVGVLLWNGFAWDGGRVNRVVGNEDWEEVEVLGKFLGLRRGEGEGEQVERGDVVRVAARM